MLYIAEMNSSKMNPTEGCTNTKEVSKLELPTERVVGEIEEFLRQMIEQMPPDLAEMQRSGPGRPRIMPSMCLWAGLLVCVLQGLNSQRALWRLLNKGNFWFYPRFAVSDQAVYKRLERAGTSPMQRLFRQVSEVLAQRLAPFESTQLAPFASGVWALDQSTLDQVARTLPALRGSPPADPRLLPGKLSALYNVRAQQWKHIEQIENPTQNEKVAARATLERLVEAGVDEGSLILADLGYFGFEWFDWLTEHKMWWVSRLRAKTSFEVIHCMYKGQDEQGRPFSDSLVWLGAYRADRAAHAVRLVTFWQGTSHYSYITSVLDPKQLSMLDIARVYARRWDIEMAFKLVKRYLGLYMLWSAKPVVVQQQVWAVLIISQIMQALQMEIAARAGVDPFEVSMPLLVEYMPRFVYTGEDPVTVFVQQGRELGFIRPSRRTLIRAPAVDPHAITPVPPDVLLVRQPRYSHRNCASRPTLIN
jgi:Transposase DDE domain